MSDPSSMNAPASPSPISPTPKAPTSLASRVGGGLLALIVFCGLGGLLVWGHQNEWTMPRFSALFGGSDVEKDWCEEHAVPESICVECKPDLLPRPKPHGWCREHGVHECPLCHPEVAQVPNPQVTAEDRERARLALAFKERPENNNKCKLHDRRIQFVSQETMEKAGVAVEPVWTGPVVEFVTGNGEVVYDQTRTARLSARVPGTVYRVFKQVGDPVRQGDILALVDAADVGRAKAEFMQALVQTRLKGKLTANFQIDAVNGTIPRRVVLETETALSEARIRLATAQQALINLGMPLRAETFDNVPDEALGDRLRFLGLPKSVAETLDPTTTTANLLAVTAPHDGVVTTRDGVPGEVVETGKTLFVIVDPTQMWLMVDVRLEDARAISLGRPIRFRHDGAREEAVGTIAWISTEADHRTRTVKVRALLANESGSLKANTFGSGRIILREEKKAIVVPNEAVHWEGDCFVVFVRHRDFLKEGHPKVFFTRTVRIGAKDERQTEVIAGVLPGELIATRGSAVLRAELLKGNLGEG